MFEPGDHVVCIRFDIDPRETRYVHIDPLVVGQQYVVKDVHPVSEHCDSPDFLPLLSIVGAEVVCLCCGDELGYPHFFFRKIDKQEEPVGRFEHIIDSLRPKDPVRTPEPVDA